MIIFCACVSSFAATTLTAAPTTTTVATPTPPATSVITPSVDRLPTIIPRAPNLSANGYVLMDANSGTIIAHKNSHQVMQPASLTKLMTLYLTFQALKSGQIHLTDQVRISKTAWQTGGSRMFIKEGSQVSVQDLIDGIIVASGNDACTALAQYVGGNQATFVDMMNAMAQQLGMKDTHYVDPTGLPQPGHQTTPYDMALLTRAIINNFPEYYPFFKQEWITYNKIKQPNRNNLLWRDPSVDGLKTGHTEEAGYCLIASAMRNGMRLISVVMGAPTNAARSDNSQALLNWGFRFYQTHKLYDANQALAHPRVLMGEKSTLPIGLASPFYVTIQHGQYSQLKPEIDINKSLSAPIKKGDVVGALTIRMQNNIVASTPLVALEDDNKGGIFTRLWDRLVMIF
ncbi:MAG: serine-type D-Ala-D-Ala carboxypeptidase [Gammaproteobacteria bacterium RIFCSPHIGHO2_02_FULL_39_13]|nr:MAG: serine-type D-Ala-D-Ala carboxypeptidase [Gammaproteobacteria bacterium RIFCSPHIGHO2_02_FULL_39_13]OGT49350.1 MAG: serine-type D-Ala-D-Ala carboxypeptidase [Gammaproteobacteria bacterium RIFCSPHIGHO2_12_FULL_39_24]